MSTEIATTVEEVAEIVGDLPMVCELITPCLIHGHHHCDEEAKWVSTMECKAHPGGACVHRLLVCETCHHELVAAGNETKYARIVDWQPL